MKTNKDEIRKALLQVGQVLLKDENEPVVKELKRISDDILNSLQKNNYSNPGIDYIFISTLQDFLHDLDNQLIDIVETLMNINGGDGVKNMFSKIKREIHEI